MTTTYTCAPGPFTTFNPFTATALLSRANVAQNAPKPVRWLWKNRIPSAGITLLDGDHGCGKSLLALQIAAAVSSGKPLPDGTPTTQGGVIIITPHTDFATAQYQQLLTLGANFDNIEILTLIPENMPHPQEESQSFPSCPSLRSRPFSLPEDIPTLLQAIDRVNARLILLDPFTHLLTRAFRCTNERLLHLLTDLEQDLLERHVACLVLRSCPAKGGHARPSILERSDHFLCIALSRLLLAPDPMQPKHLLLSHALSRHNDLTPTLILRIQPHPNQPDYAPTPDVVDDRPQPDNPREAQQSNPSDTPDQSAQPKKPDHPENSDHPIIPYITVHGIHSLQASDFLAHRPDSLHHRLLFQYLRERIFATTDPLPASALYAHAPTSSTSQIQRALNSLVNMGQVYRPARGFYASASANPILPILPSTSSAATTPPSNQLDSSAATTPLSTTTATTLTSQEEKEEKEAYLKRWSQEVITGMKVNHAKFQQPTESNEPRIDPRMFYLNEAIRADPILGPQIFPATPTDELTSSAATTSFHNELTPSAATTSPHNELTSSAATTFSRNELTSFAATDPDSDEPDPPAATETSMAEHVLRMVKPIPIEELIIKVADNPAIAELFERALADPNVPAELVALAAQIPSLNEPDPSAEFYSPCFPHGHDPSAHLNGNSNSRGILNPRGLPLADMLYERAWRESHMDNPYPKGTRLRPRHEPYSRF